MADQTNRVIVCITNQMQCTHLIHAGEELAKTHCADLYMLSVQPRISQSWQSNVLEHLYYMACQANADMTVVYDDNPAAVIVRFLREHKPQYVVINGLPHSPMHTALQARFPDISFVVVQPEQVKDTGT